MQAVPVSGHFVWDSLYFLYLGICFPLQVLGDFSHNVIKLILKSLFFLYLFRTPIMQTLVHFLLSQISFKLLPFFKLLFFLLFWPVDFQNSKSQIMCVFFCVSLLFIPSTVFFVLFTIFLCSDSFFFYVFFSSLLKFSLCLPLLFPNSISILVSLNSLNSKECFEFFFW